MIKHFTVHCSDKYCEPTPLSDGKRSTRQKFSCSIQIPIKQLGLKIII